MEIVLSDRLKIVVSEKELEIQKVYSIKVNQAEWQTLKTHYDAINQSLEEKKSWSDSWSPYSYKANARRIEVLPQGYVVMRMERGVKPLYLNISEWKKIIEATETVDCVIQSPEDSI